MSRLFETDYVFWHTLDFEAIGHDLYCLATATFDRAGQTKQTKIEWLEGIGRRRKSKVTTVLPAKASPPLQSDCKIVDLHDE